MGIHIKRIDKNYIVLNGNNERDDAELFFPSEVVTYICVGGRVTMWDILLHAGLFPSKGQARKNWTRTGADVPGGFSYFTHLGCAHSRLTILNPIAGNT